MNTAVNFTHQSDSDKPEGQNPTEKSKDSDLETGRTDAIDTSLKQDNLSQPQLEQDEQLNTKATPIINRDLEQLIANLKVSKTIDRLPVSRTLTQIEFGNKLDNQTNQDLFQSLGFKLERWKRPVMSLFSVFKNDKNSESKRSDLCRNIVRSQLTAIGNRGSSPDNLPLNLIYQKLKLITSDERKVFIINYFDLHLNEQTASDFAQQHVKRFLRYFNNGEKSDLIHWLCGKNPSKRRTDLIYEIFQSSSSVKPDLQFLVEKTSHLTELKKDKLFKEFYALAEFSALLGESSQNLSLGKKRSTDKITDLEKFLTSFKEQISNSVEFSKTKTAVHLIQICTGNLKALKDLKRDCKVTNDYVKLYKCFSEKIPLELKYGILIEADLEIKSEQLNAFAKLTNQLQVLLEPFSELFFYSRGNGIKIKFFKKLIDEETGIQFGRWDHQKNTIELSLDTLDDAAYLKEIISSTHLQATIAHEIGHFLQLGNNGRFEIATNEERVIYKLVSEELALRKIDFERVIAILARSDDFKSLSQVINVLDKEQIQELENPQLINLCARVELLANLQLNQPPTKLAPSANSKIIGLYKQQLNDYVIRQIEICRLDDEYSESKFASNHMESMLKINKELNQHYDATESPADKRNLLNLYRQVIITQLRYGICFSFPEHLPAYEDFRRFIKEFLGRINESNFLIQQEDFSAEYGEKVVTFNATESKNRFCLELEQVKKRIVLIRTSANFTKEFLKIDDSGKNLDRLISEKQKRIVGQSRPEVDFDEFMQIAEWKLIPPRDYELKHGMNIVIFKGKEYQLGLPVTYDGKCIIFVLSNDMLFCHNATNEAHHQFPPSVYARLDPWENFAEIFAWYCLQPKDLIAFCLDGFVYMEGLMNFYEKNRSVMNILIRALRMNDKIKT